MDNKILPIEDLVKQGLVQKFRQVFDIELTITQSTGKREQRAKQAQGRSLKYPLAFATPQTWALSSTRYRAQTLLRRGMVGQATSDNLGTFKIPLIPIDTTYQILYVTNDGRQAESFAKLWLMAAAAGFMTFEVVYGVVAAGIHMTLDARVNASERDSSPDAVDEHEVTTSLIVEGYGSHDQLINQQAANTVEVEGRLLEAGAKALLQEGSPGQVQVFTFKRGWPQGKGPLTS